MDKDLAAELLNPSGQSVSGGKKKEAAKTVRLDTDADLIAEKRADWRPCRQYKGVFVRVGGEFDDED